MKVLGLFFCSLLIASATQAVEDTAAPQVISIEEQEAFFEAISYMTSGQRDFELQLCEADCRREFATPSLISMQKSCLNLCKSTRQFGIDAVSL